MNEQEEKETNIKIKLIKELVKVIIFNKFPTNKKANKTKNRLKKVKALE